MKKKNIIVISYYLPPMGGGGVQRTSKFVKYLTSFGWNIYLIGAKSDKYYAYDKALNSDIEYANVIRINICFFDYYFPRIVRYLSKRLPSFIGQIFYYLDFFTRFQFVYILKSVIISVRLINKKKIDIIYTSSGPKDCHLIGLLLKIIFRGKVKWISDYRDLWLWYEEKDKLRGTKRMIMEKELLYKILFYSNVVININDTLKKELISVSSYNFESKSFIIENGYDTKVSKNMHISSLAKKNRISIAYFGQLFPFRSPECFFKALEMLYYIRNDIYNKIDLCIYGPHNSFIHNLLKKYSSNVLNDKIHYKGYISNKQIGEIMHTVDILLLIIGLYPCSNGTVTGKIFEYIASGIPILAIIPNNGEASKIINSTNTGLIAQYNNPNEICNTIIKLHDDWIYMPNYFNIEKYSRKNQAKKLDNILSEL